MGPPASVFLCVGLRSQLTFCINNGTPHLSIQHNLDESLFSLPLLLMHLLHHNWILILLKEIKTEAETCYCSKKHWYPKIGDLSGSWLLWWVYAGWSRLYKSLHAQLWQEKRRWSRRGLVSSFSAVLCGCVWVGMESSCLYTVLWVWLQTDGLMARSNKQSLDIWFRSLSAPWKTRCKLLLYSCHNDYAIWVCDIESSVLSSNTVHLPSQQYTEIIVSPLFAWAETGMLDVITQTKVCLQSAGSSRRLTLSVCLLCFPLLFRLCSEMVWEMRSSFCSSSVDESTRHRNSFPTLSPLIFFISLHHTSIIVSISFFRPSLTPRPPALEPLQTTSCLCWSIDPHSCVSVASVWAGLCEIGLLIRWRWVAEI